MNRQPADRAALRERVNALHALRGGLVAVVLLAAALAPAVSGSRAALVGLVSAYVLVEAGLEAARRRGARASTLITAGVMLDGVFLAGVLYRTGGASSYLAFLVELHVVAVCLLASYRSGLKLSIWYTLLFALGHFLERAGAITDISSGRPLLLGFGQSELFGVLAFWMVAIGTAVFSSLNERELRRSRSHLRALAEMSATTATSLDGAAVPAILLDQLCATFDLRRAAVVLPEPAGLRVVTPGSSVVTDPTGWPDPVAAGVLATGQPALVKCFGPADDVLSAALPGATNVVVVPLAAGGDVLGVVALEWAGRSRGVRPRSLDMVGQFATHAAMAIRNANLHAEVQRLATTDALTGLANRRVFEESLTREVARAERAHEPLAVVILDVDHFKHVNDVHGHQTGDDVLRLMGAAMGKVARTSDIVARFGGEEFIFLLPGCDRDQAIAVAERVREAISEAPLPFVVTASAGVAVRTPGEAVDGNALVGLADQALYRAKRKGRNRVEASGRPTRRRPRAAAV